ncbi:hypothetical protein OVY29_04915 [Sphingopyxis sp. SE2]|jgi:hypothetical protein|uniref:hypothetical protein n=1 Tax=Sphingopyxis sp. SE2 TaxID=1586240 RepID=UPI0028C327F1|nr:hypothetical protein [Sphingopyxis sp. SE2]MDT7527999.1 hypothetical protein [Sphingopyxis sp. SE2]
MGTETTIAPSPELAERQRIAAFLAEQDEQWADTPEHEKAEIIDAILARSKSQCARVDVVDGRLTPAEDDSKMLYWCRLVRTFATNSDDFVKDQLDIIGTYFGKCTHGGNMKARSINSVLAFVAGCAPQNEMQAAIAVQMALTNDSAARALTSMTGHPEAFNNIANKLLRTFAVLAETLNKMQRGGTQTVKHIHVNQGGQAIVADTFNHSSGEGGQSKSAAQSHATAMLGGGAPMLSQDSQGNGVPIPSGEGKETVSNARRH